jgi:hypothetical protein
MRVLVAIIGTVGLLPVTAFCLFGSAATFEPTDRPGVFMAFRIGYAVIGPLNCVDLLVWPNCLTQCLTRPL